jgi:hypothetical protein
LAGKLKLVQAGDEVGFGASDAVGEMKSFTVKDLDRPLPWWRIKIEDTGS